MSSAADVVCNLWVNTIRSTAVLTGLMPYAKRERRSSQSTDQVDGIGPSSGMKHFIVTVRDAQYENKKKKTTLNWISTHQYLTVRRNSYNVLFSTPISLQIFFLGIKSSSNKN